VVDAEPNNDTSNEELNVAYEQLCGGSFHSIYINLPVLVYVIRSIESTNVRENVLYKQS
jgi:hypothetical protein